MISLQISTPVPLFSLHTLAHIGQPNIPYDATLTTDTAYRCLQPAPAVTDALLHMHSSPPNTDILDDWDLLDSSLSPGDTTSFFSSICSSSDFHNLTNWHITNKSDVLSLFEPDMSSTSTISITNSCMTGISSSILDPMHDHSYMHHWSSSVSEADSLLEQKKDNIFINDDLFMLPHSPTPPHQESSLSSDTINSTHSNNDTDDWSIISIDNDSELGDRDRDHGNSASLSSARSGATTLKTDFAP